MLSLGTDMKHTDVMLGFSRRGDAGSQPPVESGPVRMWTVLHSYLAALLALPESSHCGSPAFQVLLYVASALAVWCVLARSLCSQGSEYK